MSSTLRVVAVERGAYGLVIFNELAGCEAGRLGYYDDDAESDCAVVLDVDPRGMPLLAFDTYRIVSHGKLDPVPLDGRTV